MTKRILLPLFLLIILAVIFAGWKFFGPTVRTTNDGFLYVKTGTQYQALQKQLVKENILSGTIFFDMVAKKVGLDKHVKPGRYNLKTANSVVDLARILKRGQQSPVPFIITKLRTKKDLAGRIGRYFETDSATAYQFLTNTDSLKTLNLDTSNVFTVLIPNTYNMLWTLSTGSILKRLKTEKNKFWTKERKAAIQAKNITEDNAYTIASIVEEESNSKTDRPLIASVYLNRLNTGMKLEADPTVKYSIGDFGLKRILYVHLKYPSAYNTYLHTGLPPGPICTPSINALDAVLYAPKTKYNFFVASPKLDGSSVFAENYEQHKINAKLYQQALDVYLLKKKNQQL